MALVLMRRQHTGSGRGKVLPPTWGAAHAPVVATTRNATVNLRRASTSAWDDTARSTTTAAGSAYAVGVSARVQSLITHRTNSGVTAAEEPIVTAPYLVAVDHDTPALVGDQVLVTACAGDLQLQGRVLRVEHVVLGSDRFERDLFCNLLDT